MQPTVTADAPRWASLIERARLGDDVSLGRIAADVHAYLLAVAEAGMGSQLRQKVGASDVVQQSLMEASQTFASFEGASESELKSWLRRIVLHNLADEGRKYSAVQARDARREVAIDGRADRQLGIACQRSPTASWTLSRREDNDHLLHAVERLPARQRLVVEARHRWGKSYRQIAAEMGVTENAARSLWIRAMQNLRGSLCEDDGRLLPRAERSAAG